ncbi:hypothetical protein QFC22_005997 [Naganishia vaughanmartiniae]|uniref:Uncharacterized protein n=1 Tax=Naganishia vaughanmartiniae TaxID=1424756 RepID=A0ACC2WQJ9_9TREE|nr:hypothetical protein QFC22_005997 [Naganishia vaughanmartiniae]
MSPSLDAKLSTLTVHGDDDVNTIPSSVSREVSDVAPALHVSTTFRYSSNPDELVEAKDVDLETLETHVYSRETAPNSTRLEAVLCKILHGKALTYSTGLSAIFAAYTWFKPKRVSIGGGYHGAHAVLGIHSRLTGLQKLPLDCPAEDLQKGDIIHLETPINPTGDAYDIAHYAKKAHSRGALLLVDSTLGPPPLQDPFAHGADIVIHSGTKYFGGHSDLLCGVLAVRDDEQGRAAYSGLWDDRMNLGSVMGNMESWLCVRSLRTLDLRVRQASRTATMLVTWFQELMTSDSGSTKEAEVAQKCIAKIHHSSLQAADPKNAYLATQMPNGHGPVFALTLTSPEYARALPSKLAYFHHATSLGGVESLVEWRAMSDETVDRALVRFSIGVEDAEDLKADIMRGLMALCRE